MAEKTLRFMCWSCKKETTVIVTVSQSLARGSKDVAVARYCEHCDKANKVLVPDNVDVHRFILGKDKGFLGYTPQGVPVLQGEQF